ncbi:hypothetical protein EST38_g12460 [Candolleomyces aberdarensis]|uniref:Uncharacterized protein n=1 Tax=Candolleomyces aberdarensis TaxID=2316362 RepID=A0A4Q2D4Y0_9AGAR|nr:hypothetical protein EST38_g12460 [Candolleomyces aberdarensis]
MSAELPVEILQTIFYLLACSGPSVSHSFHDLLSVSHVCTLWRSAALRASPAWACVLDLSKLRSGFSNSFNEVFKRTAGLSDGTKAVLREDAWGRRNGRIEGGARKESGALKGLWLAFDPEVLNSEGVVRLSAPRPVGSTGDHTNTNTNTNNTPPVPSGTSSTQQQQVWTLFSGFAPHLQRIHLQNCLLDFHPSVLPSTNIFANLTSFQLVITRNLPAVDYSWIEVFRAMPQLETLHLLGIPPEAGKAGGAGSDSANGSGSGSGEQEVVKFGRLKDLAIVSYSTMVEYLTKRIELPSAPSLSSTPSIPGDGYGIPGALVPKCHLSLNVTLPPEPNILSTYGVNFVQEKFRGRTGGVKEVKLKIGEYSLSVVAFHYEEGRNGLPKSKRKKLAIEERWEEGHMEVTIEDYFRTAIQEDEGTDLEEDVDMEPESQPHEQHQRKLENQRLVGYFHHPDVDIDLSGRYTSWTQLSLSLAQGLLFLSQHALSDFLSNLSSPSANSASGIVPMLKNVWKVNLDFVCDAVGFSYVNNEIVSNHELLNTSLISLLSLFIRAKRLIFNNAETIKKVVIPILQGYPPVIASECERQLYYCYNKTEGKKDMSLLPILFPNVTVIEVKEECLEDDAVCATLEAYEIWRVEMGRAVSTVAVESSVLQVNVNSSVCDNVVSQLVNILFSKIKHIHLSYIILPLLPGKRSKGHLSSSRHLGHTGKRGKRDVMPTGDTIEDTTQLNSATYGQSQFRRKERNTNCGALTPSISDDLSL